MPEEPIIPEAPKPGGRGMEPSDAALAAMVGEMLGGPPATPDPVFRIAVIARLAERARRRAAGDRALRRLGVFAGIGFAFAAAQYADVDWSALAQPVAISLVAVAAVGALALGMIEGPAALASRARGALRVRI